MPKQVYYWDTCLFFEWLGKEPVTPEKRAGVREILQENEEGGNIIVTSVITHLEMIPSKLEAKNPGAAEDYWALFDAGHFAEIEINTNILLRAREIRDHYYAPAADGQPAKVMQLGDAIHLATASIHGVDGFHTRDADGKKSNISLLKLYENSGNDKLCGKYELPIQSPASPQGDLLD